jgi:aspartate 1-decarboxylase
MFRRMLRSKIHRATVTQADLDYEGSVTLPPELMQAAAIEEYEAVQLWDVTSGARLETYAIRGLAGSEDICVNGAAAHLIKRGDIIIIACFGYMEEPHAARQKPRLIFVDERNRIREIRDEVPGPLRAPAVSSYPC